MGRGVGTHPFHFTYLSFFWFSDDIDEVLATMACWNKVSPVSSYLNNVWPGARWKACVSLCPQICWFHSGLGTLCLFQWELLASYWCSDFNICFCIVLWLDPVSPTLWIGGNVLQACFVWGDAPADAASAIFRSRLKTRVTIAVFQPLYDEGVRRCRFSLLLIQCNYQCATDDVQ